MPPMVVLSNKLRMPLARLSALKKEVMEEVLSWSSTPKCWFSSQQHEKEAIAAFAYLLSLGTLEQPIFPIVQASLPHISW